MDLVLMEMILNHANTWRKEEMSLTIAKPVITNSREPNMTRITSIRLNTAYPLEPNTAIRREGRVVKTKKQPSVGSIRLVEIRCSLIMLSRPKTLRIGRFDALHRNCRCQMNVARKKGRGKVKHW